MLNPHLFRPRCNAATSRKSFPPGNLWNNKLNMKPGSIPPSLPDQSSEPPGLTKQRSTTHVESWMSDPKTRPGPPAQTRQRTSVRRRPQIRPEQASSWIDSPRFYGRRRPLVLDARAGPTHEASGGCAGVAPSALSYRGVRACPGRRRGDVGRGPFG